MLRATFAAGSFSSGTRLGIIAPAAAAPNASPTPIKKTANPNKMCGIDGAEKKIIDTTSADLNKSAPIMTFLRGNLSAHTPANGAKTTPDKIRAPRINPREVAVPPASRTATASAIGNADAPRTKILFENQKNRYPL
jgi:hypothetical protein